MTTQPVANSHNWKRPFFTIWIGQAISLLGSQLVQFALIWFITEETGSATALAGATMVAMLPQVFLSPFIGALVDRWNRKQIMLIADAVIALATLVMAALFALEIIQLWHIYVLLFVRSIGGSFHRPAMTSSTSLMVPKEHLTRIQGINQTLNGGLNIVSAPLGALLIEILPTQSVLAIDVVTAAVAIGTLFFIAVPQPERAPQEIAEKPSMLREMKAGFDYVWNWRGLLYIAGFATLLNFIMAPAFSLMPLLIKDHFGGGAMQLGWANSAFGVGVILGGVFLGIWGGFKRRILTAIIGITGIGIGALLMGIAPENLLFFVLIANLVVGFAQPIANGALGAILQATVDPAMQGRIFTLLGSVATAMMPVGLAIAGPLSDRFGIQTWFIVGGITFLVLGALMLVTPAVMNVEQVRRDSENIEVVAAD
jgi:MFS transporter, DHA3 family, macrolide efflux protein